jgi:hypothetical protein
MRNHQMAHRRGGTLVTAERVVDAFSGFDAIAQPGRRQAMSDAHAVRTFRLENTAACLDLGMPEAALFFAPWSLLYAAIASTSLSLAARIQMLEVCFALFREAYRRLRGVPRGERLPQRGAAGVTQTMADLNQLRRAMNLCIAICASLTLAVGAVALGRIGTHSVEAHFGITRSALRGVSDWRSWIRAEGFASLMPELRRSLGLGDARPRRSRSGLPGARVGPEDPDGAVAAFECDLRELLAAARTFVNSPRARRPVAIFLEYLHWAAAMLRDEDEPAAPGPLAGPAIAYRPTQK